MPLWLAQVYTMFTETNTESFYNLHISLHLTVVQPLCGAEPINRLLLLLLRATVIQCISEIYFKTLKKKLLFHLLNIMTQLNLMILKQISSVFMFLSWWFICFLFFLSSFSPDLIYHLQRLKTSKTVR